MKITKLSLTEVANASVLPTERKRAHLLAVEDTAVWWGYQPINDALPKLLLAESTLFGHLPKGNDAALVSQIEQACRSGGAQKAANVAVAQAVIEWRNANNVTGRIHPSDSLKMGGDRLKYCSDVVVIFQDRLWVLCPDWRSSMTLSLEGKEFMKSLIYHTALVGDLRDASVAILRTPKVSNDKRKAIFEELIGEPKYSLDDVVRMVSEVYSIWETVLRARRDTGQAGTGT